MATPHIRANNGDIAKSILLPGDPLRAKYIAETFLEDAVLFNDVRGIYGYTGRYKGRKISAMGTGMGIPSIAIYVNEIMDKYGVKNAIRIGTCGAGKTDAKLGDVILAQGCCTNSDFNRRIFPGTYCPVADFDMLRTAYQKATGAGSTVTVGNMLSSDMFYPMADDPRYALWEKYGVIGVEMEGAALYTLAKKYNARALVMCTVSDAAKNKERMTPEERERSLNDMITLALDTVWEFSE